VFFEVFQNLIVNAWDVAPEKSRGIGIQAETLSQGPNKSLCVRIEDEGPGVPPRIRQQIFDPSSFYQAERSRTGAGRCPKTNHGSGREAGLREPGC
jgi:signal transduction histidine kinase